MINSIQNEMAFIGSLYKEPVEIVNYYKTIDPIDYFTEDVTIFLYDRFVGFYEKFLKLAKNIEISEKQFNIFMMENKDNLSKFKDIGGWKTVERFKNIADEDKIKSYFSTLKKYALVRKLEAKGFPVTPLVKHKKFDKLSAEDIIHAYNHNLSQIMVSVSNEDALVDITQDISNMVENYITTPYLGTPFKWSKYTDYFLGMNKGDMLISFGYVNTGKSRKSVTMIADLVFKQNKRVAMFDNEMSLIKTKNCLITTICNDPDFNYNLSIPERNIKLGIYKDEQEKKKVIDAAKFVESKKDLWYFKQMNKFSDEDLELEIRKAVLGLDCEFIFYGTLKGYGKSQGEWATLKTTTTHLKNLSNELDVYTHCSAQLDMKSANLNIFELNETNIGESKGIVQICDFALIDKEIVGNLLTECNYSTPSGTQILDSDVRWNASKVLKNRDGGKPILVQRYDLDYNIWDTYYNLEMSKF